MLEKIKFFISNEQNLLLLTCFLYQEKRKRGRRERGIGRRKKRVEEEKMSGLEISEFAGLTIKVEY